MRYRSLTGRGGGWRLASDKTGGENTGSLLKQELFLFTTVEYTFLYKQPTTARVCKCLPKSVKFLQHDYHHDHPWEQLLVQYSASQAYCHQILCFFPLGSRNSLDLLTLECQLTMLIIILISTLKVYSS